MKKSPPFLIIISVLLIALFTGLNCELSGEEPRRAIVAMEMMLSGDYIQPRIFGEPYYNKPPLFNWMLIGAFRLTGGFEEWAVRLPSLLSFLLTGLINFLVIRKWFNNELAIFSSLFFLTSSDILFWGSWHAGEIDLWLTLPVYIQVVSLFLFYQKRQWLWMFLVSYSMAAVIFLAKHFSAVLFQGLAIFALMLHTRQWRWFFNWRHGAGIVAFLAITGSYFFVYSLKYPLMPFLNNLLFETTIKTGAENFSERLNYTVIYPLRLIKILLPWSLLAYFLFKKGVFIKIRQESFIHFSLIFATMNFMVHWFMPETHDRYLHPVLPFITIVLAWLFQQHLPGKAPLILWLVFGLSFFRIIYNFAVLNKKPSYFRDKLEAITDKASGNQVFFTGWLVKKKVGLEVSKDFNFSHELTIPMDVPYQIPYYYTKNTEKIMRFHPTPEPGNYYISPLDFIKDSQFESYDTIRTDWIKNGLLFCKLKDSAQIQ